MNTGTPLTPLLYLEHENGVLGAAVMEFKLNHGIKMRASIRQYTQLTLASNLDIDALS
jgi:hypothetical protein